MKQLQVKLGERSYPIYIGQQLLSNSALLAEHTSTDKVMVVTNTTVAELYLEQVTQSLESVGKVVTNTILPDGEQFKNLAILNQIFTDLLAGKHGRDT